MTTQFHPRTLIKKVIITGTTGTAAITGKDRSCMAQHLLHNGYNVYGTYRRVSIVNFWHSEELGIQNHPRRHSVKTNLTDFGANIALVQKVQPSEIYNLAAQNFVSFSEPYGVFFTGHTA